MILASVSHWYIEKGLKIVKNISTLSLKVQKRGLIKWPKKVAI